MDSKIKLRWLTRQRRITAEQVRSYQEKWDLPLSQAKRELEQSSTTTVLQVWETYDTFGNGTWQDIPQELEYYD